MLDQNTDRMWFVIGALVVGAGIILLANKAMPEVFASAADSFKGATDKVTLALEAEALKVDVISDGYYTVGNNTTVLEVTAGHSPGMVIAHTPTNNTRSGVYVSVTDLGLKPNTTYEMTYDIQKLEGDLMRYHGYANDRPGRTYYVDGEETGTSYYSDKSITSDFDKHSTRLTFTTPDEIIESDFISIQPGRHQFIYDSGSTEAVVVRISNWQFKEVVEEEGE